MILRELKDKLNTLTEEQLNQSVIVFDEHEEIGNEITTWDEQDEDIYWLDGDCYGNKESVLEYIEKDEDKDDPLTIEAFHVIPKGYFTLEYSSTPPTNPQ